jgi:hypothetical protein
VVLDSETHKQQKAQHASTSAPTKRFFENISHHDMESEAEAENENETPVKKVVTEEAEEEEEYAKNENETPVKKVATEEEEEEKEYTFGRHREWLRDRTTGKSKYGDWRPPCPICYAPPLIIW